jgi:hypothetical protein
MGKKKELSVRKHLLGTLQFTHHPPFITFVDLLESECKYILNCYEVNVCQTFDPYNILSFKNKLLLTIQNNAHAITESGKFRSTYVFPRTEIIYCYFPPVLTERYHADWNNAYLNIRNDVIWTH